MAFDPRNPKKGKEGYDSFFDRGNFKKYVDVTRKDTLINPRALAPIYVPALMNQGNVPAENGPEIPGGPYVTPAGYVLTGYVENTP